MMRPAKASWSSCEQFAQQTAFVPFVLLNHLYLKAGQSVPLFSEEAIPFTDIAALGKLRGYTGTTRTQGKPLQTSFAIADGKDTTVTLVVPDERLGENSLVVKVLHVPDELKKAGDCFATNLKKQPSFNYYQPGSAVHKKLFQGYGPVFYSELKQKVNQVELKTAGACSNYRLSTGTDQLGPGQYQVCEEGVGCGDQQLAEAAPPPETDGQPSEAKQGAVVTIIRKPGKAPAFKYTFGSTQAPNGFSFTQGGAYFTLNLKVKNRENYPLPASIAYYLVPTEGDQPLNTANLLAMKDFARFGDNGHDKKFYVRLGKFEKAPAFKVVADFGDARAFTEHVANDGQYYSFFHEPQALNSAYHTKESPYSFNLEFVHKDDLGTARIEVRRRLSGGGVFVAKEDIPADETGSITIKKGTTLIAEELPASLASYQHVWAEVEVQKDSKAIRGYTFLIWNGNYCVQPKFVRSQDSGNTRFLTDSEFPKLKTNKCGNSTGIYKKEVAAPKYQLTRLSGDNRDMKVVKAKYLQPYSLRVLDTKTGEEKEKVTIYTPYKFLKASPGADLPLPYTATNWSYSLCLREKKDDDCKESVGPEKPFVQTDDKANTFIADVRSFVKQGKANLKEAFLYLEIDNLPFTNPKDGAVKLQKNDDGTWGTVDGQNVVYISSSGVEEPGYTPGDWAPNKVPDSIAFQKETKKVLTQRGGFLGCPGRPKRENDGTEYLSNSSVRPKKGTSDHFYYRAYELLMETGAGYKIRNQIEKEALTFLRTKQIGLKYSWLYAPNEPTGRFAYYTTSSKPRKGFCSWWQMAKHEGCPMISLFTVSVRQGKYNFEPADFVKFYLDRYLQEGTSLQGDNGKPLLKQQGMALNLIGGEEKKIFEITRSGSTVTIDPKYNLNKLSKALTNARQKGNIKFLVRSINTDIANYHVMPAYLNNGHFTIMDFNDIKERRRIFTSERIFMANSTDERDSEKWLDFMKNKDNIRRLHDSATIRIWQIPN